MEDTYVLHLFRSTASSFSSQYLLPFLKSSRSCVLLVPTPFTSVICPSTASRRRQFLLRIWPIKLTFLRGMLFRSVLFYPIRSRTCSLVTFSDHFIFSILLEHQYSIFKHHDYIKWTLQTMKFLIVKLLHTPFLCHWRHTVFCLCPYRRTVCIYWN